MLGLILLSGWDFIASVGFEPAQASGGEFRIDGFDVDSGNHVSWIRNPCWRYVGVDSAVGLGRIASGGFEPAQASDF
jgi:hypothetical protein